MARKEIFTKEDILNKSILFIKEIGLDKLTVRELSKYIGCSTQPIFRYYKNMDEFKEDLKIYLRKDYESFINKYIDKEDYLMTISYGYSLYAKNESNAFKALFLSDLSDTRTINEVFNTERNIATLIAMRMQYNISRDKAENVYRDVRFYTHGIASQLSNKSIKLSDKEIYELIFNIKAICLLFATKLGINLTSLV